MPYYLYILYSAKIDRYYVGSTSNLSDRLHRHNTGRSKYTKRGIPWEVVYTESFPDRPAAVRREREIKKKKSRVYVEGLLKR
ncbi:MAG: GIY-YIG nuclease family protein [Bacteroidota bacterium]